jgi:signal transduction histidine kinase
MITRLRLKLTLWFVTLFMTIYAADAVFAYWLTDREISSAINEDLSRMCDEVLPDVKYLNGSATLADWGEAVRKQKTNSRFNVELFDAGGKLMERYGTAQNWPLTLDLRQPSQPSSSTVFSKSVSLPNGQYLQVQVPTTLRDAALQNFIVTKLFRFMVIAVAVGVCGWYYSGKAIEPLVRALSTLRKFVDDAGHELKTPVTVIQSGVETLEADLLDKGLSTSALVKIQRASDRLKGLATELLLLARMEKPQLRLAVSRVDLRQVIAEAIAEVSDRADARDVLLEMSMPNELIIDADQEGLTRVVINLVQNAVGHTPAGGRVVVSIGRATQSYSQPCVFIEVRDTGEGIPRESLPFIFDRFFRVNQARSRDSGDTGLGLAIVKAIVKAHSGKISVDSTVGQGTKFVITLPMEQNSQRAMPLR